MLGKNRSPDLELEILHSIFSIYFPEDMEYLLLIPPPLLTSTASTSRRDPFSKILQQPSFLLDGYTQKKRKPHKRNIHVIRSPSCHRSDLFSKQSQFPLNNTPISSILLFPRNYRDVSPLKKNSKNEKAEIKTPIIVTENNLVGSNFFPFSPRKRRVSLS